MTMLDIAADMLETWITNNTATYMITVGRALEINTIMLQFRSRGETLVED